MENPPAVHSIRACREDRFRHAQSATHSEHPATIPVQRYHRPVAMQALEDGRAPGVDDLPPHPTGHPAALPLLQKAGLYQPWQPARYPTQPLPITTIRKRTDVEGKTWESPLHEQWRWEVASRTHDRRPLTIQPPNWNLAKTSG